MLARMQNQESGLVASQLAVINNATNSETFHRKYTGYIHPNRLLVLSKKNATLHSVPFFEKKSMFLNLSKCIHTQKEAKTMFDNKI